MINYIFNLKDRQNGNLNHRNIIHASDEDNVFEKDTRERCVDANKGL